VRDRSASSVWPHRNLLAFRHNYRTEPIHTGWKCQMEQKFPEFPNFRKIGQPREADQNFQNEFPEIFCSI